MSPARPWRLVAVAVVWVVALALAGLGGRAYITHLSDPTDPPQTEVPNQDEQSPPPTVPETRPAVGVCYQLSPDTREGAGPRALRWDEVGCNQPHVSEVYAHLEPLDPSATGDAEQANERRCVDAFEQLLSTLEATDTISTQEYTAGVACVVTTPERASNR